MIQVMELPQTVEWAVHCCWLLAQTDGSPVPRRRLAEFFDLPEPYLAKLLKALVAAEVLSSVPGVNGGYRLARPANQVTVLDVVRAANGHTAMFHCAEIRQRGPVGLTPAQCRLPCGIAKVMYEAELAWRNALAAVTVAELTENAAGVSADRAARWLGPQARAGLMDRSNSGTPLSVGLAPFAWVIGRDGGAGRHDGEQAGGQGERRDRADVEHEFRADDAACQHGGDDEDPADQGDVTAVAGTGVVADARQRHGEHRRGEVRHGELAGDRILDPHRDGEEGGDRVDNARVERGRSRRQVQRAVRGGRPAGRGGDDQGDRHQRELADGGDPQVQGVVMADLRGHPPAQGRADQEAAKREKIRNPANGVLLLLRNKYEQKSASERRK